jgi:site-specific recombinase XerD
MMSLRANLPYRLATHMLVNGDDIQPLQDLLGQTD